MKSRLLTFQIFSGCIGIIKSSQQSTVMGIGHWALGIGHWALGNSQQSTVNSQQSTVNS
ncbi:MAG: hypothetical protein WBA89_00685 [Microcoleus sp.]|uniref:hypothetical protein n=1 Tax=Microcoleus sp. TaxID=44472 RepID=UPI003C76FF48